MKYKGLKLRWKQIAWEKKLRSKLELIDHKICNYENKTRSVINIGRGVNWKLGKELLRKIEKP